jgi:hypothetical protein
MDHDEVIIKFAYRNEENGLELISVTNCNGTRNLIRKQTGLSATAYF